MLCITGVVEQQPLSSERDPPHHDVHATTSERGIVASDAERRCVREFVCVYETERGVKMADGEAEQESGSCPDLAAEMPRLEERLQGLEAELRVAGEDEAVQAASDYCQRFCQVRRGGAGCTWAPSGCKAELGAAVMVEAALGGITGLLCVFTYVEACVSACTPCACTPHCVYVTWLLCDPLTPIYICMICMTCLASGFPLCVYV